MPWDDIIKTDYGPENLPSDEVNTHGKVIGTQIEGGNEAHGAGVVGATDLVVTAGTGLSVAIAAGRAIISTEQGLVYVEDLVGYTLTGLPASEAEVYVYVGAQLREDPEDPDSREDASVAYAYNTTGGALANHLLLAQLSTNGTGIVAGSVVDERTFIRGQDALNRVAAFEGLVDAVEADVAAVKAVLGDDYYDESGDPVEGASSVSDRLTALESSGEGGAVYWGALEQSSGDATTIEEYVAAQLATSGGTGGGGDAVTPTVVQLPSDLEIVNHLRLLLRTEHVLPGIAETQESLFVWVPGISDDGMYDEELTTAAVDDTYHTVG